MTPALERPPKVTFALTETCNLDCRHCYADCHKAGKRPELSTAEWLELIDYLAANGVIHTYIEGGEPLLRPDIFRILRRAASKMMTLLRTNGTLIDAATARRLKASGVGQVFVDLMGACSETHDWFAGVPGSFELACAAVRHLVAAGIKTDVLTILNKRNAGEMQALLHLAHGLGAQRVGVLRLYPLGRVKRAWDEFALSLDEQMRVVAALQPPDGLGLMQSWHPRDRNCCWQSATVNAYGDSIGCPYLREYVNHGNVKDVPFMEMWDTDPLYKSLRAGKVENSCASCDTNDGSRGGCRSTAYAFHGRWTASDPFCPTLNDGVDLRVLPEWLLQENPTPPDQAAAGAGGLSRLHAEKS
jgi:radical SAM protein with 4Fe4S-binding SPASM domain